MTNSWRRIGLPQPTGSHAEAEGEDFIPLEDDYLTQFSSLGITDDDDVNDDEYPDSGHHYNYSCII